MEKDDGGPAFPQANSEYIDHPVHGYIHRAQVGMEAMPGMTLRDYFAAHAPDPTKDEIHRVMEMERMANPHNEPYHNKPRRRGELEIRCSLRFAYADAMLAARAKEGDQ